MNIVLTYIKYPMAIGVYYEKAFRNTPHTIYTACPYPGPRIRPWGNYSFPRHASPPDLVLPLRPGLRFEDVQIPFKPDLWVQIDAGFHIEGRAPCPNVIVGTDPHALNYERQRREADCFYNMNMRWSRTGDRPLPYAYSRYDHHPVEGAPKRHDVMFVGMIRWRRKIFFWRLRRHGIRVELREGAIFEDYRKAYAEARIGFNRSAKGDLNARVFEILAMGVPLLTDEVRGLSDLFVEGRDYIGYRSVQEAADKCRELLRDEAALARIGENGRRAVAPHTYDARVSEILKSVR